MPDQRLRSMNTGDVIATEDQPQGSTNDLVNKDMVRAWLWWSLVWYESAGIAERKGDVPIWLWVVVVLLLIWGVYYLVTYWNVPIDPT